MRINSSLYYILKDHLGSASVVTDASGNTVGENRYFPFGETRLTTGSILTDKLFTSQREITGLGIYHYQARFYSPKTGRFLSADTIVQNPANPQAFNRYSYVLNNPLRYIDPSGHDPVCGFAYSDPECESPSNDPVVITNPDPLDVGLPQADPTPSSPDVTLPIPTLTPSTGAPTGPNWGKIALGVGILFVAALPVILIGAGIAITPGGLAILGEMLIDPHMAIALGVIVAGEYYVGKLGVDMIVEGIQGK